MPLAIILLTFIDKVRNWSLMDFLSVYTHIS